MEKLTKRPLKECVHEVAEVLNLSRELRGGKRNVSVIHGRDNLVDAVVNLATEKKDD